MRRILLSILLWPCVALAADPVPLIHAHAHNDYEHPRPLLDALDHGFTSVEADIHLVPNPADAEHPQLLVAHDRLHLKPDRTLQRLYLDPLRDRAAANNGSIYRDGPTVLLWIDIKTDARTTYAALKPVLEQYAGILTRFRRDEQNPKLTHVDLRAVTVIITGNRIKSLLADDPNRLAAFDGLPEDLDANPIDPPHLVPVISGQWRKLFTWRGTGPLPPADETKLRAMVEKAHAQKRHLRFWDAPDTLDGWKSLRSHDVDLLNTDDLAGCQKFLLEQGQEWGQKVGQQGGKAPPSR